jgi:hypothetical protein
VVFSPSSLPGSAGTPGLADGVSGGIGGREKLAPPGLPPAGAACLAARGWLGPAWVAV